MKTLIFGAGGCGRSLLALMRQLGRSEELLGFLESSDRFQARDVMGLPVLPLSDFDPEAHQLLLALGTGQERAACRKLLPPETVYATCVHPQAFFLELCEIPPGCIIYPQTYFSRNLQIGPHSLIMPGTVVGHDVTLGADFTTSAQVSIGGGAQIGDRVYCGLNVAIRDHIKICADALIGMGAVVTRSLTEPGCYIGNPAHLNRPQNQSPSQFI